MLNTAVREELIARNVARLVRPPTPEHEEIHPWTDEEARRFLKAASGHRLRALFVVALALGLRRGELLGLRWSDIDVGNRQLRVAQTLQRVRGEGLVFGPPKSKRSRRTLTMPAVVAEALIRHHNGQAEDRRRAAEAWVDTGLVFTTSSGRHLEPRNLNTAYGRLLAHADVPASAFMIFDHFCNVAPEPGYRGPNGHGRPGPLADLRDHEHLRSRDAGDTAGGGGTDRRRPRQSGRSSRRG